MAILANNTKLIKVGTDYSAGSGISIDDHVISVTSNQEASIVVQNNSATWNEISAVSGNYWPLSSNFTAKNSKIDINGLVNHHLYLGGANPYIRGVVDGFPYYNWEIHSRHVSGHNWEYGVSEYNKLNDSHNTLSSNSGTWSDVSTTVQTNSAQWSDNTGDEEVNEFVYNNSATINEVNTNYQTNSGKYLTTADSANFYPSNNPSGFITGVDLSNYYTKNDTSSKQEIADAFASVPAGDAEVNSYVHSNSAALNESTNVVQSNSATWSNTFDPSYMSGAIDNKLDESAFEDVSGSFLTAHQSLDGYATEDWVTAQGYITGVDLSEYAKTNDVLYDINSAVSGKLDTTSFSTVSGTFLTAHQDISNKLDTTAFSTVSGDFLTAVDLTPYYTTAEADTLSSMLSAAIDYVSANAGDEFPASANEAITAYQNASGTYLTAHQIIPSAKWEDASDCVQTNSANWSFIPTYDYTDGDLISAIDTSGLYATSALESKSANILNKNGVIGAGAYFSDKSQANHNVMVLNPTSTPFGTTSGIYSPLQYAAGAVITYGSSSYNTQYFGGFLKGNEWYISNATAHQALRGETHGSRGVHLSGSYEDGRCFDLSISAVSGKNDTANGYNWKLERGCVSGKGTQGEWCYGVAEDRALRTVSALEYNAVDEISGIAGSAIAQYGAEKQWLQHDDTIVHVANSAQYAFGCNISALQRLMGVDQTLLFSATTSAGVLTANLSEPLSSFNTIEVYSNRRNAGDLNLIGYTKFNTDYTPTFISITGNTIGGTAQTFLIYEMFGVTQTALTFISGTNIMINGTNMSVLESPGFSNAGITKIVGIGRRS